MNGDKTNRGVLARNDAPTTDGVAPYTGHGNLNGEEFWIIAEVVEWNGSRFFSMRFVPRGELQEQNPYTYTATDND